MYARCMVGSNCQIGSLAVAGGRSKWVGSLPDSSLFYFAQLSFATAENGKVGGFDGASRQDKRSVLNG